MKTLVRTFAFMLLFHTPLYGQSPEEQQLRDRIAAAEASNAILIRDMLTDPSTLALWRDAAFAAARGDDMFGGETPDPASLFIGIAGAHIAVALMFEHLAALHGFIPGSALMSADATAISNALIDMTRELAETCVESGYQASECAPIQ